MTISGKSNIGTFFVLFVTFFVCYEFSVARLGDMMLFSGDKSFAWRLKLFGDFRGLYFIKNNCTFAVNFEFFQELLIFSQNMNLDL